MFRDRLTELLKKRGYTKTYAADKIGITEQAFGKYCNGKCVPDYENLCKIADLFDVTTDFLLGRTQPTIATTKDTCALIIKEYESLYISDTEFAGEIGVHKKVVRKIFGGEIPDHDTLTKIARYFKKPLSYFVGDNPVIVQDNKLADFVINSENKAYIELALKVKELGLDADKMSVIITLIATTNLQREERG